MNIKKYIFFDIDGTLTNDDPGGVVLPSSKIALQKLEENGHFIALATGRALYLAKPFMEEHGFKHMVSDGGNGITVNGKLVGVDSLNRDDALRVIEECTHKNIPFSALCDFTPTTYALEGGAVVDKLGLRKTVVRVPHFRDVPNIFKVFIDATPEQEASLDSLKTVEYTKHPATGIVIESLDKFKGIRKIIEFVDGNLEDVVVFGDAKNDIKMMKEASFSIAMGNAIDEVKDIASYITRRNDDDGIYYACKHFGWI
jgi:Cof subfamily protein (haloacid dehalogenase superfamily)